MLHSNPAIRQPVMLTLMTVLLKGHLKMLATKSKRYDRRILQDPQADSAELLINPG